MGTTIGSVWRAQLTLTLAIMASSATSSAAAQSVADGKYTVKALHSGQCLDVIDGATAAGGNVVQWPCDGRASQQWYVVYTGDGYYELVAAHSSKALDVAGAGSADGVNVQQWDENGTPAQRFAITSVAAGVYSIVNRNSGKAVDVSSASQNAGANVHQWSYLGGDNQKWRFTKLDGFEDSGPITVPARIQAEDYLSYADTTPGNTGGAYRADDVDLEATNYAGGYNVGWVAATEYLAYRISVPRAGQYKLTARVSTPNGGRSLSFHVDGSRLGSAAVPNTGGWQNWQDTSLTPSLPAGVHELRVVFDTELLNLDYVDIAAATTVDPDPDPLPDGPIVPLFTSSTPRLGELTEVRADGTRITRFGGRVRDRHARENQFQAYQHWLPNYFVHRTFTMEIVDTTRAGGNTITFNMTTNYPHANDDMRLFFLGNNTVAEYHINAGFPRIDPYHYSQSFSYNQVQRREIRAGDLMEFEVGIFLDQPVEGRFNYYSNAWLYRAGDAGLLPWEGTGVRRDSVALPDTRLSGGGTTDSADESNEPESAFMQMATNIAPVHTQPFTEGRRVHHTSFLDGSHSEPGNPALMALAGKAGPLFNESTCVNCHTGNGRSTPPTTTGTPIDRLVFKVGEKSSAGGFVAHSRFGNQLQTRATAGATPEATASILRFDISSGRFSDGTSYELSKPVYTFSGAAIPYFTAVTALPLVGLGLLEAIDERSIIALADPDDANRDGISGRVSSVRDPETDQTRLGRFGWKADRATVRHQVGTALSEDMGVSNPVFKGANGSAELPNADLILLTDYLRVLAVPPQRAGNPPTVARGSALFDQAGCESCHTESLRTGQFHPFAELRNQEIRPYSDLLLHDMGEGLASTLPGATASEREWRTAPLWGIGVADEVAQKAARYLHDGRARSVLEAILWHGGEAEAAKQRVLTLNAADRAALLAYIESL